MIDDRRFAKPESAVLLIARDTVTRIGKHAWNVLPQEACGYLLGRADLGEVHAALPCSRSAMRDSHADRWNGIDAHLAQAESVAALFDVQLVGFYASLDIHFDARPAPDFPQVAPAQSLLLVYRASCCHSCSGISLQRNGTAVTSEDYKITQGRRINAAISRKRIHAAWRASIGDIDYSRQDRPPA